MDDLPDRAHRMTAQRVQVSLFTLCSCSLLGILARHDMEFVQTDPQGIRSTQSPYLCIQVFPFCQERILLVDLKLKLSSLRSQHSDLASLPLNECTQVSAWMRMLFRALSSPTVSVWDDPLKYEAGFCLGRAILVGNLFYIFTAVACIHYFSCSVYTLAYTRLLLLHRLYDLAESSSELVPEKVTS